MPLEPPAEAGGNSCALILKGNILHPLKIISKNFNSFDVRHKVVFEKDISFNIAPNKPDNASARPFAKTISESNGSTK